MKKINNKFFTCLFTLTMLLFSGSMMAQTFSGTGGAIPPVGTSGSADYTVTVPNCGTIGTAGVTIDQVTFENVTHTFASDIEIDLISPSGTSIGLMWDDGGSSGLDPGTGPCTIVFEPVGADPDDWDFAGDIPSPCNGDVFNPALELQGGSAAGEGFAAFTGEDVIGEWTLRVNDDAGGDIGSFTGWSVTFSNLTPFVPFNAPAPVVISNDAGLCGANVTLIATGGCDPIANDYTAGGLDASGFYPTGTTTVTWTGGGSTTVTVNDDEAPVLACPGDMTIHLDPGACDQVLSFDIQVTENCPFVGPATAAPGLSTAQGAGSTFDMIYFDVENTGTEDINITSFDQGQFDGGTYAWEVYTTPGTAVGNETNAGVWTLGGTATGSAPGGLFNIPLAAPVVVPAGGTLGVAIGVSFPAGNPLLYAFPPVPAYPTNASGVNVTGGSATLNQFAGALLAPRGWVGNVNFFVGGEAEIVPDANNPYASGEAFPIGGPYTMSYSVTDNAGNVGTCSFDVTIEGYEPTTFDITCNSLAHITLDAETCSSVVGADQILLGNNYSCYDNYTVLFDGGPNDGQPVVLGPGDVGNTYNVMVTNPNGTPCWGSILVEDKTIPELVCQDASVRCDEDTAPGSLIAGTIDYAFPTLPSQDNNTVTETVVVPAGLNGTTSTVLDLNVAIESTHTWVGDLVITVTSPSGTSVELLNNLGGPGFGCNNAAGADMSVVLDDSAAATYADMDAQCPPVGTFQPLEALSAFNGEDAAGTWTISVQDLVGGDGGDQDITLNLTATNSAIIAFPVPATTTVLPTNDANTWTLLGFDPCGPATLTSSDSEAGDLCAGTRAITRTWTVTDGAGNSNSCTETITITPTTIADVLASLPTNVELQCGATLPPVLTDIGCSNIGISLAGPPVIIDICGGPGTFKMLREYIIVDWCTNETATHVQIIKVSDTQAPVLTCPADMNISTSSNSCSGAVILTAPTWTDCAGGVTVVPTSADGTITNVGGNWTISDIASGTTATVTWTATDACDNASTCDVNITVSDDIAPTPVCIETTTVSITSDGTAFIYATSLNTGSHDNCGIVEMLARRMDNPACPGFDGTPYAETVPFSCCDVNTTVMVEFRVRDAAGNVNSCMVEVLVEDKIGPSIICPSDKNINCDASYLDDITLGQPLPAAAVAANGEAIGSDNCSVTVTNSVIGNAIDCGAGTVTVVWTATDAGGLTASCIQRYFVANNDPFDASNISWPLDYTATTCGTGLEPTDLSSPYNKPVLTEGACDNVAYGHWDLELTFGADDACLKILRKWYVIDWCQASSNQDPTQAGPGVWHHTQIIKVVNSNDPNITAVTLPATIENFDAACGNATATFNITADDDCTDQDNLQITWEFSTGTSGSGTSATGQFANGSYSVTFTVNDGCDNEATLVHNFIVKDAKKPTPICIAGLATTVMPSSGSVSIPVSAFQSGDSYDNCTDYAGLQFSFSQDVNNTAMVITCDDIPADNLVPVTMYVTDAEGNFDFCSTFIFVQDPTGACPDPTATIQGTIQNELEENIQDVTVTLSDDAGMNMPVVTLADGTYNFGMTFGDYDVTPEKDINYLNGVTTYDLALISRHILGTEILDSPYKWIAADANKSETITALDIIKLRALILHIDDELANNDSWRFVEKNYVFQTTNNPLADDFPEYSALDASNTSAVNFTAVKIGDVNGTAIPNQLLGTDTRTFDGKLALQVATEKVAAGEEFTVDFQAKDFNNILGYQFTLGFDNNAASFVDVTSNLAGLTAANFGMTKLSEGVITTSWNQSNGVDVEENEVLFSLTFVANTNLNTADVIAINSRYTESEAYSGTDLFDVVLEFNGTEVSNGFELYQNTPNPFKAETQIGFNVPEAGAITLKVFDVSGRVLRVVEMDAAKGFNSINLDRASLDASGVLYYQLETATETATKKMIIVD